MKGEEILGFIVAAYGYLADMAERGDYAARILRDKAEEILEQLEGEA